MWTPHWLVKKKWTQWTHFSLGILALWWSLAPGIAAMWAWLLGTISVSSATWHWEGGIRWLHYCKCLAPVTHTNTPTHLCLLAYLLTYLLTYLRTSTHCKWAAIWWLRIKKDKKKLHVAFGIQFHDSYGWLLPSHVWRDICPYNWEFSIVFFSKVVHDPSFLQ